LSLINNYSNNPPRQLIISVGSTITKISKVYENELKQDGTPIIIILVHGYNDLNFVISYLFKSQSQSPSTLKDTPYF